MTQPDIELLKVNPSPFKSDPKAQGVGGKVRIEAPEFTHLDPDSEVPHMASIVIEFVPREYVIDADAFGIYLRGFRDFVAKPEDSIRLLCEHIAEKVEPYQVTIQTRWSPRHGVAVNPSAVWTHPDLQRQAPAILAPSGARVQ